MHHVFTFQAKHETIDKEMTTFTAEHDDRPRVALLTPYETQPQMRVLKGIARYGRRHGPWRFQGWPSMMWEDMPYLHGWRGDGIVLGLDQPDVTEVALETGAPIVTVPGGPQHPDMSHVSIDDEHIARQCADHLVGTGAPNLVCVSRGKPVSHMVSRIAALLEQSARNVSIASFPISEECPELGPIMGEWLKELSKPVAIYFDFDQHAVICGRQCIKLGLRIPDAVAYMCQSLAHEELTAEFDRIDVTHVGIPYEDLGYKAAAILDARMRNPNEGPAHVTLDANVIVPGRSTDVEHGVEPAVALARRIARDHATTSITVAEIAQRVPLSRRALAYKYKAAYDETLQETLARLRMERAEHLLCTTDLPMKAVAVESGFQDGRMLSVAFKRCHGIAPTAYRARHAV